MFKKQLINETLLLNEVLELNNKKVKRLVEEVINIVNNNVNKYKDIFIWIQDLRGGRFSVNSYTVKIAVIGIKEGFDNKLHMYNPKNSKFIKHLYDSETNFGTDTKSVKEVRRQIKNSKVGKYMYYKKY